MRSIMLAGAITAGLALAGCASGVEQESEPTVDSSLSQGINADEPLEDQLFDAIRAGDIALSRALLDAGADATIIFDGGVGPLHLAIVRNDAELVKVLLDGGADVNQPDTRPTAMWAGLNFETDADQPGPVGSSPLHLACLTRGGDGRIIEVLLEAGADPFQAGADAVGNLPIHNCASSGNVDGIVLFLAAGVDVNQPQTIFQAPPLAVAAWAGEFEVVELLILAGADPTLTDLNGGTARGWASTYGHTDVVALLDTAGG